MSRYVDFLLLLLTQFTGGPNNPENKLVRFGLSAILWAVLFIVAWARQRQPQGRPRERLLMYAFAFGFARDVSMFGFVSLKILDTALYRAAVLILAPLEHALAMAAIVMIAGAFLRYLLDDEPLAHRYLRMGLSLTAACYLATFWWWPGQVTAVPELAFHQTWAAWLFHLMTCMWIVIAMIMIRRRKGWLRSVVSTALLFFFFGEIHVLGNALQGGTYRQFLCPLGHAFHMLAIPMLGYVYIREQTIERQRAESQLRAYQDHLEDLVAERTLALRKANEQLQQEIHVRKRAEESIERLSRKYHLILNSAGEGIFLVDKEGNHTFVNPAAAQMLGYEAEDLIGTNSHKIWHHSKEDGSPHPESECPFYAQFRQGGGLRHGSDQIFWRKDGSSFPVEYVSTPFYSEQGELAGVVGIFRDITARRQAETEIAHRNAELAAQYAIAANINQTLDLDAMLNTALRNMLSVLDMISGSVFLLDRDTDALKLQAHLAQSTQEIAAYPLFERISEDAIAQQTPVVLDLSDYSEEELPAFIVEELKTLVSVPLSSKGNALGALTLGANSKDFVQSRQLDLLTGIGRQIGVAVENAYLYQDTEDWVAQLSSLHRATVSLASTLDPAEIFQEIARQAARLLKSQAYVFSWGKDPRAPVNMACTKPVHDKMGTSHLAFDDNLLLASLLHCRHSIAIEDVEQDSEMTDFWRENFNAQALLALPVGGGERPIGILILIDEDKRRNWQPAEIELAESFTNHAAVALENALLHQRAEVAAALEERQRIASDMHDGLAQTLSYMGYKVDEMLHFVDQGQVQKIAENCHQMRGILDQASEEVRLSITSLQQNPEPPKSLETCVEDAIVELIEGQDYGANVQLDIDVQTSLTLTPDRLEQVLRIAREAVLNALRHAQADQIVVRVRQDVSEITVSIVDDGCGYDAVQVREENGGNHFGLQIMRARAARLDGTLDITSEPDHGTAVTLRFEAEDLPPRRSDMTGATSSTWMHPEKENVYEWI